MFLESIWSDLRHALRQLRRSPAFVFAVVVTLSVAIGANTAIFSVVQAVLLRPIPYQQPERLLCVWHGDGESYPWYTFSVPKFEYFRQGLSGVADIAAYDDETVTLTDRQGSPQRVEGGRVSANFFPLLGTMPQMGRNFLPSEDQHGANPVALLSDRLWRQHYHADPSVLGRAVNIDGETFTIIGVLPKEFQFQGQPVDVWRSRIVDTRTFAPTSVRAGASYLTVIARLHAQATLPQVQAQLNVLTAQYRAQNPANSDIVGPVSAELLQPKLFRAIHLMLIVLWCAVICLLVIACANVANLMLARATVRQRDIGVRLALGAGRRRIAQQLIVESLLLSLASVAVSLPLTLWGMRALAFAFEQSMPGLPDIQLNLTVLFFTFGIACLTGLLFGLTPMWMLGRQNSSEDRRFSASRWSTQFRNTLVAGQTALCLVLLAAAGLLTQSFVRMNSTDTGLHAGRIALFPLDLMPYRYESWTKRVNFYDDVLRRVETVPGVTGLAIASRVDLVGAGLHY